jgi:hypothetical protein
VSEPQPPDPLAEVRRELVRLGYLSHRFERFLLQDALAPRGSARGLVRLAAKVGIAAGSLLAAANVLVLGVANRALAAAPLDLLLLFLHVLVPVVAASALGFVGAAAAFRTVLVHSPRRGLGFVRIGAALVTAIALFAAGVWFGGGYMREMPAGARAALAAALVLLASGVAKLVADGLLAFGIRLTRVTPQERLLPRGALAATVGGSAAAVALAALFLAPLRPTPPPTALPVAAGERVAIVGIDGVLADEIDYLLSLGELPAIGRLAQESGVVARYERPAGASPAELWTTVATGRLPAEHGVVSLDGYRPLGLRTTLVRGGPWRRWFRLLTAVGLAEQRPLLSDRRRAPAFWELVARGGRPVAAVNWWGTYPAEPLPGVVVAHGAFEALAAGDAAAVAPPARRAGIVALRDRAAGAAASASAALAGLGSAEREDLERRALAPDRFHREVAAEEARAGARALAVYLPGLDLAAAGWRWGSGRFAELVESELAAADRLVEELARDDRTLIVVFDPGRRGGSEGRVLIRHPGCRAAARPELDPRQLAAALLRAAGLPQSRELPPPPAFCAWPAPPAEIASFGERAARAGAEAGSEEYLETLRSLGYL